MKGLDRGMTSWTLGQRVLAALILVPLGFGLWIALGFNHAIANGGQIDQEVLAIRSAVPNGATDVHVESSAATWIGGCSAVPGSRSGWTTDQISIGFRDSKTPSLVVEAITRSLRAQGWRRHDESPGPHQGKIAHWSLNVQSGHRAQAWAYPFGPGKHHWGFSGSWRPPGPVGQGCP